VSSQYGRKGGRGRGEEDEGDKHPRGVCKMHSASGAHACVPSAHSSENLRPKRPQLTFHSGEAPGKSARCGRGRSHAAVGPWERVAGVALPARALEAAREVQARRVRVANGSNGTSAHGR
jgi:hypothetical protein